MQQKIRAKLAYIWSCNAHLLVCHYQCLGCDEWHKVQCFLLKDNHTFWYTFHHDLTSRHIGVPVVYRYTPLHSFIVWEFSNSSKQCQKQPSVCDMQHLHVHSCVAGAIVELLKAGSASELCQSQACCNVPLDVFSGSVYDNGLYTYCAIYQM